MWIIYRTVPFSLFRTLYYFESNLPWSVIVTTQIVQLLKQSYFYLTRFQIKHANSSFSDPFQEWIHNGQSGCCIIKYLMLVFTEGPWICFCRFMIVGSEERKIKHWIAYTISIAWMLANEGLANVKS